MRSSSRIIRAREDSKVVSMPLAPQPDHDYELTAFRGLVIAATASALFWSIGLTVTWLLLARN
jgi:hypothetical protein